MYIDEINQLLNEIEALERKIERAEYRQSPESLIEQYQHFIFFKQQKIKMMQGK